MSAVFGSMGATYGSIVYGDPTGGGGGGGAGSINRTVNQSLNLIQSAGLVKDIVRVVTQTITYTDQARSVIPATAESELTFVQDVSYLRYKVGTPTNTLALSQVATFERSIDRLVTSTLVNLHQTVVGNKTVQKSANNTLSVTQAAVGLRTKPASNLFEPTQTVEVVQVKAVRHLLEIQQFVAVELTLNRAPTGTLQPYHQVMVVRNANLAFSNTLNLTQVATGRAVKNASNIFALSQTVNIQLVKDANNFFGLGHFVDRNVTYNVRRGHRFRLAQAIDLKVSLTRGGSHVLGFNQNARATLIKSASASNTLVLVNDVVQQRYLESVEHSIEFTQSASGKRIITRSAQSSLLLTQSMALSKTMNRSISHTLAFQNTFQRNVNIGGRQVTIVTAGPEQTVLINGRQYTITSAGPSAYVPSLGSQFVVVRTAEVVKVERFVALQGPGTTLILPTPEFNDSENWTGTTNVKRTMSGSRYIYKKANIASHLSYTFVTDRLKALELRRFLLQNNSTAIRMVNWKGEVWIVVLTNNPYQITEEGFRSTIYGNRCRFTLEFEGVRIL